MTLAALETPLVETLDPGIYVESKDRDAASEDDRQSAFVAYMRRQKQFRVAAIPNDGKRSRWAAAKAKRLGLLAGEMDIEVTWADALTARIEFKNGKSMPSAAQIESLNWYFRRGHPVAVCRTLEGAVNWLISIGAPCKPVRVV